MFFSCCALKNVSQSGLVFLNHSPFSYTVDASGLRKVGLFRWKQEAEQMEKEDYIEIKPGDEKDFTIYFENHGETKNKNGEIIDYGKMIVQKSEGFSRHIADITFNARYYEASVSVSLNGNRDLRELIDEQKEFAVTRIYMRKGRKWGNNVVFTVEKFEEGRETYIDWDLIYMTADELRERDRKRSQVTKENIGCCGFFRKKRNGK
jgi:hypothetical protein